MKHGSAVRHTKEGCKEEERIVEVTSLRVCPASGFQLAACVVGMH